ncbi:PAS domain S-box-containing protein/diguanylate cyclase (GGDEF) domain-containing protein [Desulfocicer vacuolatum DSM 3385]|uniref:PAS domain S-box-containing protein/diguanylate cyclase (GGDEF) domain-containing protein n=1 Tax=Desulfocicer vacuolatum DSM 3385 TaxID=1121400 RepID=A0A1W2ADY7_9BACT|nr:EAL domain-containing protein [Desulfocicer vacuolatum]SMC58671.1 PAS domain S-box-containing protein/diguanylate cyclase (GGDEF) domain-containing protein [Desulfocicer vacuolatum DSM 3385]
MKLLSKLTLTIVAVSLFTFGVVLYVTWISNIKALETQVKEKIGAMAVNIMDKIDRDLAERMHNLETISTDPIIMSRDSTPRDITERLLEFRNIYKRYISLSFFDLDRVRIADTSGLHLGVKQVMTKYWEDVLQDKLSIASDIRVAEELNNPTIYFASLVKDKNSRPFGAVISRMSVAAVYDIIGRNNSTVHMGECLRINLLNKDGLIIYSNNNRKGILREKFPGWEEENNNIIKEKVNFKIGTPPGEEEMIMAFCHEQGYLDFEGNGWTLCIYIPTRIVFAPIVALKNTWLLILFPGIILIFILSSIISIKLSRPLNRLKDAVVMLGNGKVDTRVEIKSRDEIGELSKAFNQMADDISRTTVSKTYVDNILTSMINTLIVLNPDATIRTVNQAALLLLKYEEQELVGHTIHLIIKKEEASFKKPEIEKLFQKGSIAGVEITYQAKNGEKYPMLVSASVMNDKDEKNRGIVITAQDITERKEAEEKLRKTSRTLGMIHACNTLLTRTGDERLLLEGVCNCIVEQTGYRLVWVGLAEQDEVKTIRPVIRAGYEEDYNYAAKPSWAEDGHGSDPAGAAIRTGRPCIIDSVAAVPDSAPWIKERAINGYGSLIGLPLMDGETTFGVLIICATEPRAFDAEEVELLSEMANDLGYGIVALRTQRKHQEAEEKLTYQAYHDSLTGLPNRAMIMESLTFALARAKRFSGSVAILFIDLDDFKLINDIQGHEAGDELLCHVAERLRGSIRETDMVARQGGDEFIVLLTSHDINGLWTVKRFEEETADVARRIINMIKIPFQIKGQESYIGASIGISLFPDNAKDAHTLMQQADSAMYHAKKNGKGGYRFYSIELSERAHKRHSLTTRLHRAIEQQEFVLFYQPFVELTSGQMVGAEALIRWQEKKGRLIPPADFLPVAEDTGLIIPISDWVLMEVCRQIRAWQDKGLELKVAVNFSVRQFWQGDIVSKVLDAVNKFGIRHDALELEITESMLSLDPVHTETVLRQFSDHGLSISLDDFGTGYSSLNRLKRFPIDKLKIDKSFVDGIPGKENDTAIVTAITQLAHNLGLQALAEGIETFEQWRFLHDLGCRYGQGYHFSRPVPAKEFEAMLERDQCWTLEHLL